MPKSIIKIGLLLLVSILLFPLFTLVGSVISPHFFPDSPKFSIESSSDSTVNLVNPQITLQFSVELDVGTGIHYSVLPSGEWLKYVIDGTQNFTATPNPISHYTVTVTSHNGGPTKHEITRYTVALTLTGVAVGLHRMDLYVGLTDNLLQSISYRQLGSLNVTIFGPDIQVTEPQNITYNTGNIPLSYVANQYVSKVNYSVDGGTNATASGNITLSGLPNGFHTITVYASDASGNWATPQTVQYEIVNQGFSLEPVQMALVFLLLAAAVFAIFITKRRRVKTA